MISTSECPLQYKRIIDKFLAENKNAVLDQNCASRYLQKQNSEKEFSKENQRLYASSLKWYFKHELGQKIKLPLPYKQHTIPTVISIKETEKLFTSLPKHYLLMYEMMFGLGLKIGEVTALRLKNIDMNNGAIYLAKERKLKIPFPLFAKMQQQYKDRQNQYSKDRQNLTCHIIDDRGCFSTAFEDQPFFASRKRTLIDSLRHGRSFVDPSTLHDLLKRSLSRTNTNKKVTTMSLRHTFAVEVLKAKNLNIVNMSMFLGQKDIRHTMKYLKMLPKSVISPLELLTQKPMTKDDMLENQLKTAMLQPDHGQLVRIMQNLKSGGFEKIKVATKAESWQNWLDEAKRQKINHSIGIQLDTPKDYIFIDTKNFMLGNPYDHIKILVQAIILRRKLLMLYIPS
jgi:integrase